MLRVVGGSVALRERLAREIGGRLSAASPDHPWPAALPPYLAGGLRGQHEPLPLTRVAPSVVVEIAPDPAFDRGHWRHAVRVVRVRDDVEARDVTTETIVKK